MTAKPHTFKWTVVFEVAESLVADGFNLTDDVAEGMIEQRLSHAYPGELKARVIRAPSASALASAKGDE